MIEGSMAKITREDALEYHRLKGKPGKVAIIPTKPMDTQRDLSLAYSPGVAEPVLEIEKNPDDAYEYTSKGNLVAVISNGTAILGLGDRGALASKPVMEGKGVLFKKFADIDVFDIELNSHDPDEIIKVVAAISPTFGGINLEDIKAPECFYIEEELKKMLNIPVFHDDQHGTAIISSAGLANALEIVGKRHDEIRLVISGAGASAISCAELAISWGVKRENIMLCDSKGVVYKGRTEGMNKYKERFLVETDARTLTDALRGADVFSGLSVANVMTPEMVKLMAKDPIIFAMANPDPEIKPELAREARKDVIIATGRSDFPNQVNNALCFPYIFRGALDVGATTITESMKLACVHAIATLAREGTSDVAAAAYGGEVKSFGRDCLIPQPFDPRLLVRLAPAVAQAAMDSGVAARPIADMGAYREQLDPLIFRTGLMMKPVFDAARREPKRVVFAEGEEEVMLRAVQTIVDEGFARPVLIGRPAVIEQRIARLGLWIKVGEHFEVTNIDSDPRFADYWQHYHRLMERKGITPSAAKAVLRSRSTVIGALMVERGEADAMIAGVVGRFQRKLQYCQEIVGIEPDLEAPAAMSAIACDRGTFFFLDTYVNQDPSANELCVATIMAVERLKVFGIQAKVALLSHSNFGSEDSVSSRKMRKVLELLRIRAPQLEVEGEMHADAALNATIRERLFPNSRLTGSANMFVFPNLDAANICFNMVRVLTGGVSLGPIVMGLKTPCYVLTNSATVRRVINMTALAVVEAQVRQRQAEAATEALRL